MIPYLKKRLTKSFGCQMYGYLEHCETSGKILGAAAQSGDPAPVLEIGMKGTRPFVSTKVRDEIYGFVSPKRGLILEWERYFESMKRHDGLN
jgi:hypothetical protein